MTSKLKKTFVGIVSSDKAEKTITVSVTTSRLHPVYKKQFKVTKKFIAHDASNEAKVGDKVAIVSTAPISKRKFFTLDEILERAPVRFEDTVEEDVAELTSKKETEKNMEEEDKK